MKGGKIICALLSAVMCLGAAVACTPNPGGEQPKPQSLPFLRAEGKKVLDSSGSAVMLRGVNAGGLGVIEQWMTGFAISSSPQSQYVARDSYTTSKVWIERFGLEDTWALWQNYMAAWWTAQDYDNCADMGINVIRLPFTYMDIDFDAVESLDNAGDYDFTFLDDFVTAAAERGIYTILDLHGAYGSQNGQDHSGQTFDSVQEVTFYSDQRLIGLTADMWGAIAQHFKDNPAVAGYDLLNEPVEKGKGETGKRHWDALDAFYKEIRAAGDEHIVIFESCWGSGGLPRPEQYGWQNCMYSFHHYTGCAGDDRVEEHKEKFLNRMREVETANFGVPLYMGEFTAYTNEEQWSYTLNQLNANGWHWTSWTYKIWGQSGWGVYNINTDGVDKINAHYDDYTAIRRSFNNVKTALYGAPFTFASGNTLKNIIKQFATQGK